MTDVTRLLENSVEATNIYRNLCCFLLNMCYEKKNEKMKANEKIKK